MSFFSTFLSPAARLRFNANSAESNSSSLIACSALGVLLFLLLFLLAVRSYWTFDRLRVDKTAVALLSGRLLVNDVYNMTTTQPVLMQTYVQHTFLNDRVSLWTAPVGALIPMGMGKQFSIWPLVAAALVSATAPWLPWSNRFSLRTLLITTTLAALLLGLTVYKTAT